jgi:hypothetical protein
MEEEYAIPQHVLIEPSANRGLIMRIGRTTTVYTPPHGVAKLLEDLGDYLDNPNRYLGYQK